MNDLQHRLMNRMFILHPNFWRYHLTGRRQSGSTPGWINDPTVQNRTSLEHDLRFRRWCKRPAGAKALWWRLHGVENK